MPAETQRVRVAKSLNSRPGHTYSVRLPINCLRPDTPQFMNTLEDKLREVTLADSGGDYPTGKFDVFVVVNSKNEGQAAVAAVDTVRAAAGGYTQDWQEAPHPWPKGVSRDRSKPVEVEEVFLFPDKEGVIIMSAKDN